MHLRKTSLIALVALAGITVARSGHELPIYPSYYPHEIKLLAVTPEHAAGLLLNGKIQAYIGNTPRFSSAPPASIDSVASLGAYVIVRVNNSSPRVKDPKSACAVAEQVIRDIGRQNENLILHPYPVTPYHGDYLHHVDLAEAARARILSNGNAPAEAPPKVKAGSKFARSLMPPEWQNRGPDWDAEVLEISVADLISSVTYAINGWSGPPWIKAGWFHASRLLGEQAYDESRRQRLGALIGRLQGSEEQDAVTRINLERSLVTELTSDCRVSVAGYTLKREYFSTVFTAGIENIAYDSIGGLNSPIFIRTVKLKDFPWNGWLAVGIEAPTQAAWNPIAGFTDRFGRLMWSAMSDPGLLPSPYESTWMFNRVSDVQSEVGP